VQSVYTIYFSLSNSYCRLIEKLSFGHKFIGTDPLDLIKFLCKEFWEDLFKKKVFQLFKFPSESFVFSFCIVSRSINCKPIIVVFSF
jgi:hypothetical protein